MRLRLPLSAKILAWFFLNLAVLGIAFFLFARVQFHLGPDWLMAGRAGDRVQAVADVIAAELGERSHAEWNDILKRFSDAYHVEFALVRTDGARVAGDTTTVPAVVRERLSERPGPRQPPRGADFRDGPGMREPGRPSDPLREPGVPRGNGIPP
jgi:two-component system sensor histidine kinase CpxA